MDELEISKALSVLERLVAAMCRTPSAMRMDARVGGAVIEIKFTVADTVDSSRVVGVGAERLKCLHALASMMFKASGKKVIIGKVEKEKECAIDYTRFVPEDGWNKGLVETLFEDTVATYFPGNGVTVRTEDSGDTTKLFAVVKKMDAAAILFAKVAYEIFVPVGIQNGRRIIADVEETL